MQGSNDFVKKTALYLKGISKTFGSNKALDDVEIMVMPGEIMGLLGKNGCGKSTLIKVLSGYHAPDKGGELYVNGEKVKLPLLPGEFKKYGMSFVHQDLGLEDTLTVAENWILSDIATKNQMKINWKSINAEIVEVFKKYGLDIQPDAVVSTLGPVQKAMLAIIRAVMELHNSGIRGKGLLVLDEPTVFLPRTEVDTLFSLVHSIAYEGISVIFVSHDLDEVMALTDSYTVLRNGRNVGHGNTHMSSKDEIIEMILGESLSEYHVELKDSDDYDNKEPLMEIKNFSGNIVRNTSFKVYPGEVLGITGLAGSGFEEIPYLLFGDVKGSEGSFEFENSEYNLHNFSPKKAVAANMALIPADRKNNGGVLNLEIFENMMMQSLKHYRPAFLNKKGIRRKSDKLSREYTVYPNNIDLEFGMLSGGNQQKVLLAKWIQEDPHLLILHEPTQGIDIGARQAIYNLIEQSVKKSGMTVICSSSDYEQLEQICDRVLIMVDGEIVEQLTGNEITKARITKCCYQTANVINFAKQTE